MAASPGVKSDAYESGYSETERHPAEQYACTKHLHQIKKQKTKKRCNVKIAAKPVCLL